MNDDNFYYADANDIKTAVEEFPIEEFNVNANVS